MRGPSEVPLYPRIRSASLTVALPCWQSTPPPWIACLTQQASASKSLVGGEYTLDCSSRSILPELKVTLGGQDSFLTGVFDVSGVTVFAFSGVDVPGLTAPWIMGDVIMRKLPKCAQSQALTRRACCVGRIHEQQRPEVEGVDPFLSAEEMIQL